MVSAVDGECGDGEVKVRLLIFSVGNYFGGNCLGEFFSS